MIQLFLLGSPSLSATDAGTAASLLKQPKRLALLGYLAVHSRVGPARRDSLTAMFWPDADTERARHGLRQALHTLRGALGPDAIIANGVEQLAVNPALVWCDAVELLRALDEQRFEEAIALYRGDFLEGFFLAEAPEFERWVDSLRTQLRQRVVEGAERLAATAEAAGDLPAAIRHLERALSVTGSDERILRTLLDRLDRVGNRAAAIATYDSFAKRLQADFDLDPSPETVALVENIRARANQNFAVQRDPFVEPPAVTIAKSLPRSTRRAPVFAGVLLVLIIGSAWLVRRRDQIAPADGVSVAVLPFEDFSPSRDQEYLSDGLTEDLITALSKVPGLRVPARTSSFVFKGVRKDIPRIARELNVTAVLEGSVQRAGNRLRITAQLIDARSGYHLWSEKYDRDIADVFAVQDEISRAIVDELRLHLGGVSGARLVERPTTDPVAYDLYLRGRYFWNKRNHDGISKAIAYFSDAVKRDPKYAAAYAGLADAYQLSPTFEVLPPQEAFPKAQEAARKAVQLAPRSAEAHASLGYIALHWEHDWATAESELRRAVTLNPAYATAHQWLRLVYISRGRLEEALSEARRAQQLDPLSISILAALGDTHLFMRRYPAALNAFKAALELDSTYARALSGVGRLYGLTNRPTEALALQQHAARRSTDNTRYLAYLAAAYAANGQRDQAVLVLQQLRKAAASQFVAPFSFAVAHTALGQSDSAFHWLNRMVDGRDNWVPFIAVDPAFDPLHDDPRFGALRRRLELSSRADTR